MTTAIDITRVESDTGHIIVQDADGDWMCATCALGFDSIDDVSVPCPNR